MSKYIVAITPVLDSVKLKYPEKEVVPFEEFYLRRAHISTTPVDLSCRENADGFVKEWITSGYGHLDFATDGNMYIKISLAEIKEILQKMINALQENVKSLTIENLIESDVRFKVSKILEDEQILIVNYGESLELISKQQWIFSEYNRILRDKAYEELSPEKIILLYKIESVYENHSYF